MPGFEIFGDEERKEVQDVLETGVLFRYGFDQARQDHWKAKEFEAELSKRTGSSYSHLCSSGTAALSIALASCGVGAGDEVLAPPFTFVATIEAVLFAGAIPVFVDIDDTLCIDPDAIEPKITSRTKAVICVHMCGAMARIDEIKKICAQKDLILIEDACQSIGSSFQGKSIGTFGHIGCYSFDPVKTITCGEGGAIITDSEKLYQTAFSFADHGHDHIGNDRGLENHPTLGGNFRISELNAAVGLAQLRKLDTILEKQRVHKKMIKTALAGHAEVAFQKLPDEEGDSATFLSFFLPDESRTRTIAQALAQAGVDGCFYWYDNLWHYIRNWNHIKQLKSPAPLPIHLLLDNPGYEDIRLPQSDTIMNRTLSMQIKLSWTEADIRQRIDTINRVFTETGR
ncbi:DegT/DnrJ/EryC1/StrS family aminotransferase [Thermodesulfobacteriota bacterium]